MLVPNIYSLIALKGSNLHIGHHILSLQGRKKTLRLMEAMLSSGCGGQEGFKRDQLRAHVYHDQDFATVASRAEPSQRLRESQDGSLSKLISRSRRFINESLQDTDWSRSLDWFVYSDKERKWQLVQNRA